MTTTNLVRVSHSPDETRSLARALSRLLAPGDLLCLLGELGAGKTTFVQGLAEGVGSPEPATSPSFTLIHEHRGHLLVYHLDLYRLGADDLANTGIEEAFRADAVVAVEWADRLPAQLRSCALDIRFDFDDTAANTRKLTFHARGARSCELLDQLARQSDACPCH